ncbi:hypothetical protein HK405_012376, partial [Cladochytrium tenue]
MAKESMFVVTSAAAQRHQSSRAASALSFVAMAGALAVAATVRPAVALADDAVTVAWPTQTFYTEPDLHPPVLSVQKTAGAALADGALLLTPGTLLASASSADIAPLIMTDDGELVWHGPNATTTNLLVQELSGQTVLTYWTGTGSNVGFGHGKVVVLDEGYDEVATVCPELYLVGEDGEAVQGCGVDLHESQITSRGTMLCTAVNVTRADLRAVGGPAHGWVLDDLFLEVDVATNEVVFLWSSLASGIPLTASQQPLGTSGWNASDPWDWFHQNSLDDLGGTGGQGYLINSRHTWSSFGIGPAGELKWTFQGEDGGDFNLPDGGSF